jgi:hypothetical protein
VFCNTCGTECSNSNRFCYQCGQPLAIPALTNTDTNTPSSFPDPVPISSATPTKRGFDVNNRTAWQGFLVVFGIVGFMITCGLLVDSSKHTVGQATSSSSTSENHLDHLWNTQSEKAMHDCVATRGPEGCRTPEEIDPFRERLVLFLVDDKGTWFSPDDKEFRSFQAAGADAQRHRAEVLAGLGDYSGTAIYLVQNRIKPTQQLSSLYPDLTASKLFYDNKLNSFVWAAVDNSQWCGSGCWMVWCFMRTDKNRNFGPAGGYWQVDVNTKTVTAVDKTATQKYFTTTDLIADTKPQQDDLERLRGQTDAYCMESLMRYGSEVGKGLCDAAIDSMITKSTGAPSAYDLCMMGADAACDIANEHMSPADPRWDSLQRRRHH